VKRGYRVVSVECDPDHVSFLRRRFNREIETGTVTIVDHAISLNGGDVVLYRNKTYSDWGTIDVGFAERNRSLGTEIEQTTVNSITAQDMFAAHGVPYYLKVDIEGSDIVVLRALADFEERPKYLSFEAEGTSFNKLRAEFEILQSLGYFEFKLSKQNLVPFQKVPRNSVHGKGIDYTFEHGSTGLFGEDLDMPWFNDHFGINYYKAVFVQYDLERALRSGLLQGDYDQFLSKYEHTPVWYDTHARHSSIRVTDADKRSTMGLLAALPRLFGRNP
jgi:FkbM family methyltransferase